MALKNKTVQLIIALNDSTVIFCNFCGGSLGFRNRNLRKKWIPCLKITNVIFALPREDAKSGRMILNVVQILPACNRLDSKSIINRDGDFLKPEAIWYYEKIPFAGMCASGRGLRRMLARQALPHLLYHAERKLSMRCFWRFVLLCVCVSCCEENGTLFRY